MIQSNEKIIPMSTPGYCKLCNNMGMIIEKVKSPEDIYGEDNTVIFVDVAYKCPGCNGGKVNAIKEIREVADIPRTFYEKDIESFKWDVYKNDKGQAIDLLTHKKYVLSFINDFDKWQEKGLGLYIYSHTKGSGKSFLSSCICNSLINKYQTGTRYIQAGNLINISKSKLNNGFYEVDPIELLCNCELLVIDDLGQKATGKEWLEDILFKILDARMTNRKVTVITSNLAINELDLDDRITDRINKICQALPLPNYCVRAEESNKEKTDFLKSIGLI